MLSIPVIQNITWCIFYPIVLITFQRSNAIWEKENHNTIYQYTKPVANYVSMQRALNLKYTGAVKQTFLE